MCTLRREESANVPPAPPPPPPMWETKPVKEEDYYEDIRGTEREGKYSKDISTGLWMVAVSEEACETNNGFICKVRFYYCDIIDHDNIYFDYYLNHVRHLIMGQSNQMQSIGLMVSSAFQLVLHFNLLLKSDFTG